MLVAGSAKYPGCVRVLGLSFSQAQGTQAQGTGRKHGKALFCLFDWHDSIPLSTKHPLPLPAHQGEGEADWRAHDTAMDII